MHKANHKSSYSFFPKNEEKKPRFCAALGGSWRSSTGILTSSEWAGILKLETVLLGWLSLDWLALEGGLPRPEFESALLLEVTECGWLQNKDRLHTCNFSPARMQPLNTVRNWIAFQISHNRAAWVLWDLNHAADRGTKDMGHAYLGS